jgi:hypothetical protein
MISTNGGMSRNAKLNMIVKIYLFVRRQDMNTSNTPIGTPSTPPATPGVPQKNNLPIIIGVVVAVIVLCCCCSALGYFGYTRYLQAKALSGLGGGLPSGNGSGSPSAPGVGGIGSTTNVPGVPSGGKGDDPTRAQAWTVALAAILQKDPMSCTAPDAASTTIEVTQQPDASGVWQEKWNVACGGGKTIPVNITITPAGGGVYTVKAVLAQ